MTTEGAKGGQRIDPRRSACVLIGVDAYTELDPLRAVRNNLAQLSEVLTDAEIWGIAPDRLKVVANPHSQSELVRPIRDMAKRAEDTLVVYYSGHGLIDPDDDQLYLTLTGSELGEPDTAVPFEWVRRAIRDNGSAKRRVLILDCCYSGKVLEGMSAGDVGVQVAAGVHDVQGSYLMTSTAQNRKALAPERERCSVFTGELVDVLRGGIPDGPETLGLNALFKEVRTRLLAKRRPEPQEQDQNGVGGLTFVRNRAVDRLPSPPPPPPPRGRVRRWALVVGAVLSAFGAGLLVPYDPNIVPRAAGGPCSSKATLLSYSDALDKGEVQGEKISGLSALALTGPSQALALTDDTNNGTGRIFPLTLGSAEDLSPEATTARTLRRPDGAPYTSASGFDGEGLVVEKDTGTVLVSSEAGPVIRRFRMDTGQEQGRPLPIPPELRTAPDGQAQRERTIEALGATPDGDFLFAGMEAPLSGDGDARGRNLLRIQRYRGTPGGTYTPDRQYAYQTGEGLNLVELVAIDDGRLLTLERQFIQGLGNVIRVYDVSLAGAPDATRFDSLADRSADDFVKSTLLFDLGKCPAGSPGQVETKGEQPNPLLDNVEGMALGERQTAGEHLGWRPLYLVSDDNDNRSQITRLYALRVLL